MSVEALLQPLQSALVIVDVQNDYCHPDGALTAMGHDPTAIQAALPAICRLVDRARSVAAPRIYVRTIHSHWFDTDGWLARGRGGHVLLADSSAFVQAGSWGAEFYGLAPAGDELVITKHRYSAFAYTPLELALQAKRVETVVLCGTQTNICVQATATDALFRGFTPILVADAVATSTDHQQAHALREFAEHLGHVVTVDQVLSAWAAAT